MCGPKKKPAIYVSQNDFSHLTTFILILLSLAYLTSLH